MVTAAGFSVTKCILILLAVWTCTQAEVVNLINDVKMGTVGERKLLAPVQSEKATSNTTIAKWQHHWKSRLGTLAQYWGGQNQYDDRLHWSMLCSVAAHHHRALRSTSCTKRDCTWPRAPDGKVYIPYVIADHYSAEELGVILKGMDSFSVSTCVRFIPRTKQDAYIFIQSLGGCYSFVGRLGSVQGVSLNRQGCIAFGTVQHELLHVLGFDHEHCRSDRDHHIQVLMENVLADAAYNFEKSETLNQRTSYDYDSVMHYNRLAFSKDNLLPTMEAFPDREATFGTATQMSPGDIRRVNLLYCSK